MTDVYFNVIYFDIISQLLMENVGGKYFYFDRNALDCEGLT